VADPIGNQNILTLMSLQIWLIYCSRNRHFFKNLCSTEERKNILV